ncbi:MAG: ATP-binding protein [Desulfomonilaceae bacterium]
MTQQAMLQGSLFEEDYLVRTLGSLANTPDVALTELAANAWDAGATRVDITIPETSGGQIIVQDDGCGMTQEQFRRRWMTLGYNRVKHQGELAEFPADRLDWRRRAYGRNGVGRHGMLCFAQRYVVKTKRDGVGGEYVVATASGEQPFYLVTQKIFDVEGHGTRLSASVERNLPNADRIREVLSARFLADPGFHVLVNGSSVLLTEHTGLIDSKIISVGDKLKLEVFCIDSTKTARTMHQHGVAFWVGGRLVGEPSWNLGDRQLLDGRTRIAKRHTIVVKSNDLFEEILPDWSSFKPTPTFRLVQGAVADYVEEIIGKLLKDRVEDTKEAVFLEHSEKIKPLRPLAKLEVSEFVEEMTTSLPTVQPEVLSVAVQAVIRLEKSRSGAALLEKLLMLSEEDVEGLNRLLNEWTVRDALIVLDEIDRRITGIEAISKLSADSRVNELQTLHPLVTQARWLFGPEFDSPEYASNLSLRNAVQKVFGKRLDSKAFVNYRNRPDLMTLEDATLCTTGTEIFDSPSGLTRIHRILIIELKRGAFKVGRDEANQASNYVEDLLNCGVIEGSPFVQAFVVGHEMDSKVQQVRTVGEKPMLGRIELCTYGQLVRTAQRRLFRLREQLGERYEEIPGADLLKRVLQEPVQLVMNPDAPRKNPEDAANE